MSDHAIEQHRRGRGNVEVEWPDLPKFDRPLVFGDPEQISALKKYADQVSGAKEKLARCWGCDGEGTITCPDCDGTGEA